MRTFLVKTHGGDHLLGAPGARNFEKVVRTPTLFCFVGNLLRTTEGVRRPTTFCRLPIEGGSARSICFAACASGGVPKGALGSAIFA